MQINNLLFNLIKQNIPKEILRENSIIEAEVVGFEDGMVILNIDGELISAKTDIDINKFLGESLKFLIENKTGEKTILKIITEENIEELSKHFDTTVDKVIKQFKLEKNEKIEKLISKFVGEKLPLTKDNIEKGVKILEKLEDLINLEDQDIEILKQKPLEKQQIISEEEITENLEMENNITNVEKNNIKQDSNSEETSFQNYNINSEEELDIPENKGSVLTELNDTKFQDKIKILNKLISSETFKQEFRTEDFDIDIKNILLLKDSSQTSESTRNIKQFLKSIVYNITEEDIIDVTNFLVKNNIKPSLNNIKEVLNLKKDPDNFINDLKNIFKKIDEKFLEDLTMDGEESLKSDNTKENIKNILENLTGNEKKDLFETKIKLDFIKDLNKEMYFNSIPLKYGDNLEGLLNIVKERETKSGTKKPINVYISLNTNNLGNIKISCLSYNRKLNIKFGIGQLDEDLFKSLEPVLIQRLNNINYLVENIDFVYEEKIEIMKEIDTTDSIYFLDIKV